MKITNELEARARLVHCDKGLRSRLREWYVKELEFQLMRKKISFVVRVSVSVFLVFTICILLVFGALSGGMSVSLIMGCLAIVASILRKSDLYRW